MSEVDNDETRLSHLVVYSISEAVQYTVSEPAQYRDIGPAASTKTPGT